VTIQIFCGRCGVTRGRSLAKTRGVPIQDGCYGGHIDNEEEAGVLLWPSFNTGIIVAEALGIVRGRFISMRTGLGPSEHAYLFVMALDSSCLCIVNIDY
jgi:hypothetical protein